MKKILAFAVVAAMSLTAAAENWYAGGQVSAYRNCSDNVSEFAILPEVGYNLNETVAVGASLGWDYNYNEGVKLNLFKVNPYVRYSFYNNDKVSIFCDATVGLGFGKSSWKGGSSKTATTYAFGFKPGISYALTDNFSLVAHVGFLGYTGGNEASGAADEFGLNLDGNDLSFGFYVNF